MKPSDLGRVSGPPTPLRPVVTRPASGKKKEHAAAADGAPAPLGDDAHRLLNNASPSASSTPLGATPTCLSVPPLPPTHISDLGDDLLREILARTGVLDRAVSARMVSRQWRVALAPAPDANAAVTGKGLCKDVDVTTEPRLLCRVSGVCRGWGGRGARKREEALEKSKRDCTSRAFSSFVVVCFFLFLLPSTTTTTKTKQQKQKTARHRPPPPPALALLMGRQPQGRRRPLVGLLLPLAAVPARRRRQVAADGGAQSTQP